MLSCEAQRTLIKSPLEPREELGDPAGLSRHLGKLGEIRITRIEPETKVEWESEELSGTVALDPSGWGTKVTLTAAGRDLSQSSVAVGPPEGPEGLEPEGAEAEALAALEPEPTAEASAPEPAVPRSTRGDAAAVETQVAEAAEPQTPAAESVRSQSAQGESTPPESIQPESGPPECIAGESVQPEAFPPAPSRRGFFARLFRKRARDEPRAAIREAAAPREDVGPVVAEAGAGDEPAHGVSRDAQGEEPATQLPGAETDTAAPPGAEAERTAPPSAEAETAAPPSAEAEMTVHAAVAGEAPAESMPESEAEAIEAVEPEATPRLGIWLEEIEQAEAAGVRASRGTGEPCTRPRLSQEEVQEVLTETLDRLGAAHHRPFSRA